MHKILFITRPVGGFLTQREQVGSYENEGSFIKEFTKNITS